MPNGKDEKKNENKDEKRADAEQKQEQTTDSAKEAAELKDRLLRLAAEFDNYKKRSAKDFARAKEAGRTELIKSLLPVLDEFELAVAAVSGSNGDKGGIKGVGLVYSNFFDALSGAGLREIEAEGKYDPYRHEIMMVKESAENEGTILEVVRKGYMFSDIVLRPASVIVSKGNAKKV